MTVGVDVVAVAPDPILTLLLTLILLLLLAFPATEPIPLFPTITALLGRRACGEPTGDDVTAAMLATLEMQRYQDRQGQLPSHHDCHRLHPHRTIDLLDSTVP